MTKFRCKYCSRAMRVSFLEYKTNAFCNTCFDERASKFSPKSDDREIFEFMGESILIHDTKQLLSKSTKRFNC
jgi:hypothetical protein